MPTPVASGRLAAGAVGLAALAVPPGTPPMEARQVERLPAGPEWQFEPKWDGFRCLAFRAGAEVDLRAKSGRPLARYFPDVADLFRALAPRQVVLDGELVIAVRGELSFEALQMRLHPAESRVRKLAREAPATFIAFDLLLTPRGRSLLGVTLAERRQRLEALFAGALPTGLVLSPATRSRQVAEGWLEAAGGPLDGVIAKRLDGPYTPGERTMLKVKRLRTADCVVGGFRYGENSRLAASLLLGLYDEAGLLHHVGFTTGTGEAGRAELTSRLEAMMEPPGFTGRSPGGPSRWSGERSAEWHPVRPILVVEVRYDHVTGDRFRHGTKFVRWRPDKAPAQCTFAQLPVRGRAAGAGLAAGR